MIEDDVKLKQIIFAKFYYVGNRTLILELGGGR